MSRHKLNISRLLLIGLLLCGVTVASESQSPAHIQATPIQATHIQATRILAKYNVLKGDIKVATINETYTRNQDRYQIESVWKAVGLLAMFKPETIQVTSAGSVSEQGLRPDTFVHNRKLDTKRNARAEFDWNANSIKLNDRSGTRTLPLPAGTQDRLSAMYQFMYAPLQGTASYNLNMTNGSKIDVYNFLITPNKSVTVPLGTFKALYAASPKIPKESRTEIWLAADHAYFPYKMVITDDDGGTLTQVLTQFSLEP